VLQPPFLICSPKVREGYRKIWSVITNEAEFL
jgi:hypothetical protein